MAAIRVKPVEHRNQVTITRKYDFSKKPKRCLFGRPQPGETDEIFRKDQEFNYNKLRNYELVIIPKNEGNLDVVKNFVLENLEEQMRIIKRPGSPRITDHFKVTKKVCKANHRPTSITTKEKLSDVEQYTTEVSEIGSTNFVTNIVTSDSALEADAICTNEPLPPSHQQTQEKSEDEVTLHIMATNHAGKFS